MVQHKLETPGRGRPSRAAIHERLAHEVDELRRRHGGLPSPLEAEGIWADIWYSEAHSSTAIEGNTLVLREVEALLRDGKVTGHKQLKEYLEVSGYAAAARWVYGQALSAGDWQPGDLLSLAEVRQVHALAMTPAWDVAPHPDASATEGPGSWRSHDIRPFSGGMTPPAHTEIQARMTDWIAEVAAIPAEEQEPIALSVAKRHAAFERIHPFLDGNGRTGRLLTNLVLVRLGYPPAIVRKEQRTRYLEALRRADRGDHGPLGELFARAILDNLMRFILPAVAGPAKLLPIDALTTSDLSAVALRDAARRGRLRAIRAESGWQSTRQWVDTYRASRYERPPPVKQPLSIAPRRASGRASFDEVLDRLTIRGSRVLSLRYGLEDGRKRTLAEVGHEFGVSAERIRQIEREAFQTLADPVLIRAIKEHAG